MNAMIPFQARDPGDLTPEKRARLEGAILGAGAQLLVTVRAGDVRSCLALAEAVQEAQAMLGQLAVTERRLEEVEARAAQLPLLRDQIAALQHQVDALKGRAELARKVLKGEA